MWCVTMPEHPPPKKWCPKKNGCSAHISSVGLGVPGCVLEALCLKHRICCVQANSFASSVGAKALTVSL